MYNMTKWDTFYGNLLWTEFQGTCQKKNVFWDLSQTMGRWGSKVPNSLVKITIQLFLGLCPKIGVAVGG